MAAMPPAQTDAIKSLTNNICSSVTTGANLGENQISNSQLDAMLREVQEIFPQVRQLLCDHLLSLARA